MELRQQRDRLRRVELRQLRYFVAVAELLHFTRAARRLHMAQPPLSRQIRALELELGVQLFTRISGRVRLTHAGTIFLEESRAVLQRAEQAVRAAKDADAGRTGTVRLGIGLGLGETASRVINRHLQHCPNIEIDVVNLPSGLQGDALIGHKIDVGFLRPPIDQEQLMSQRIRTERLSVVLRRSSPLAAHRRLHLRQLARETLLLIAPEISPGVYEKTLALYRLAGIAPRIVPTESTPLDEAGAVLVDAGKGIYIAVGSHPCHPSFAEKLTVIPLSDANATVEVHVAWRRSEQARAVLKFVELAMQIFGSKRNGRRTVARLG
jgi:DNA-binding transcriptional LysR family regulator